jgi:hypothetical protein
MNLISGVPDGYVLKAASFVGKAAEFYFEGDQAVIIDIQCLSLPITVTVSKIQRTAVQDWWTTFCGAPTYHWDDVVTDSFQSWITPPNEIYVETDLFGTDPVNYHFRVETGALIAAVGQPRGAGSAPGLLSVQFFSNE